MSRSDFPRRRFYERWKESISNEPREWTVNTSETFFLSSLSLRNIRLMECNRCNITVGPHYPQPAIRGIWLCDINTPISIGSSPDLRTMNGAAMVVISPRASRERAREWFIYFPPSALPSPSPFYRAILNSRLFEKMQLKFSGRAIKTSAIKTTWVNCNARIARDKFFLLLRCACNEFLQVGGSFRDETCYRTN